MGQPCSGEKGRRQRGPREGEGAGAHGGPEAPSVEGCADWTRGSRREPKVVAERSLLTARLR
jgi:hypothetical protein